jgi:serine/threonine protein kinase
MSQIIEILRTILKGLLDCHSVNIIHRDLKPQNIIIDKNNLKPKIIDFGLSLLINPNIDNRSYKRCGTMGYMAPEVAANTSQSRKPYSAKCDIFSFGIIVHMILLGYNPLKGKNYEETFEKNMNCDIELDK